MASFEELSDKLWTGEHSTRDREHHPFAILNQLEEITDDVGFYKGFSNMTAVRTGEGLALIDTGSYHPVAHARSFKKVRDWSRERISTAIYTHGHVDHAYGLPPFLAEAEEKNWERPAIVAHRNLPARMKRYIATAGYNADINRRQFNQEMEWPTDPIYPTETFESGKELLVGGVEFHIRHAKGETDDHAWVWLPERRVLCTGDLFIWAAPNAGNPQKVQRYCIEWARGLRKMAALEPEFLLPGHGLPVFGAGRVRQALTETAEYLESLYNQTLELMNSGAPLHRIVHEVKPPAHLTERPFLQPIYDEPEFIVHNIFRCLGGWYSGRPCELKPAPIAEQSAEIAALAGGAIRIIDRASALSEEGNLRLACHLADWAAEAAPEDSEIQKARAAIYEKRTQAELSTMAKGVFGEVARG